MPSRVFSSRIKRGHRLQRIRRVRQCPTAIVPLSDSQKERPTVTTHLISDKQEQQRFPTLNHLPPSTTTKASTKNRRRRSWMSWSSSWYQRTTWLQRKATELILLPFHWVRPSTVKPLLKVNLKVWNRSSRAQGSSRVATNRQPNHSCKAKQATRVIGKQKEIEASVKARLINPSSHQKDN